MNSRNRAARYSHSEPVLVLASVLVRWLQKRKKGYFHLQRLFGSRNLSVDPDDPYAIDPTAVAWAPSCFARQLHPSASVESW